jgi:hypothetical protein
MVVGLRSRKPDRPGCCRECVGRCLYAVDLDRIRLRAAVPLLVFFERGGQVVFLYKSGRSSSQCRELFLGAVAEARGQIPAPEREECGCGIHPALLILVTLAHMYASIVFD